MAITPYAPGLANLLNYNQQVEQQASPTGLASLAYQGFQLAQQREQDKQKARRDTIQRAVEYSKSLPGDQALRVARSETGFNDPLGDITQDLQEIANASQASRQFDLEKKQADLNKTKATTEKALSETKLMNDPLSAIQNIQGMAGNVPVGTTVSAGPFNIPLNPKLTQDQTQAFSAGQTVIENVDQLKNIIKNDPNRVSALGLAKAKLNPIMINEQTEEVQAIIDRLKGIIPFAKGGKQLTDTELKLLTNLLPRVGQRPETINSNLDAFVAEFERLQNLALGGSQVAESIVRPNVKGIAQISAKKNDTNIVQEGTTAVNPNTGERIIYRGGQWQTLG